MSYYEVLLYIISPLTVVLTTFLYIFVTIIFIRKDIEIINLGGYDEIIVSKKQYKKYNLLKIFSIICSTILFYLILLLFLASAIMAVNKSLEIFGNDIRLVVSDSMSVKNERNEYLFENNLNNQFSFDDLIILNAMPDENDLKLYDIVAYIDAQGNLIIHRIIEIELVGGDLQYTLRGDANRTSDRQTFFYDDFVAIYSGNRIIVLGTLVRFFQSPIGFMAFVAVLLISVCEQIYYIKTKKAIKKRFKV